MEAFQLVNEKTREILDKTLNLPLHRTVKTYSNGSYTVVEETSELNVKNLSWRQFRVEAQEGTLSLPTLFILPVESDEEVETQSFKVTIHLSRSGPFTPSELEALAEGCRIAYESARAIEAQFLD